MRITTLLAIMCSCTLYSCNNRNSANSEKSEVSLAIQNTTTPKSVVPMSERPFAGSWYWKSKDSNSSFKIVLKQENDSVYGQYCAAYDRGNRMDCDFDTSYNLSGKISKGIALITFNSFYGAKNGKASLMLKCDTLIWEIKKFPDDGDCFAPEQVNLTHNNQNW